MTLKNKARAQEFLGTCECKTRIQEVYIFFTACRAACAHHKINWKPLSGRIESLLLSYRHLTLLNHRLLSPTLLEFPIKTYMKLLMTVLCRRSTIIHSAPPKQSDAAAEFSPVTSFVIGNMGTVRAASLSKIVVLEGACV